MNREESSMNILIDGPDGSGKSTLCNELILQGFQYVHSDEPEDAERYFTTIDHMLETQGNIALDRGPISNIVYSHIFDGGANMISSKLALSIIQKLDVIVLAIPGDRDQYLRDFNVLKDSRDERYDTMAAVYDEYESRKQFKGLLHGKKVVYYDRYKIHKDQIKLFVKEKILNAN